MVNLVDWYAKSIDASARKRAAAGRPSGQFDGPLLPLIAPWAISGPVLGLVQMAQDTSQIVFGVTLMLSLGAYASGADYYRSRVEKFLRESSKTF